MSPRAALVTGGSTGIGAEVCRSLLDAGYEVVTLARHPPSLASPKLHFVEVDLADPAATAAVARDCVQRFDILTLIHNAGVVREKPLAEVTTEDLDTLTHLHVGAAITLAQACLPSMKAAKFGRIVLVSSRAMLGLANRTVYSATKAGMVGLARTWALELASFGITVNVVAPGPIEATGIFHEVLPPGSPRIAKLAESIPVKRLGRPEDVARAVSFFVAPENSFVTGQTLFVCGGTSVGSVSF